MVKISTKYPLTETQVALLDEKKQHWWLQDVETRGFVKAFPRLGAAEPVDVDIELVDSKYCMGCGDWNTVDEEGHHCSKRVYFMVTNGAVRYFKNKAELDSATAAPAQPGQISITDGSAPKSSYSAFGGSATQENPVGTKSPSDTKVEEVPVETDIVMYCVNDKKTTSRNYNCVMNFVKRCEEVNEEDCYNCKHGRALFYKNLKE